MELEKANMEADILRRDVNEVHAKENELKNIDKFLSEISKDMSDEQLSAAIGGMVEEYLVFADLRNTVDCFVAEEKCARFKPTFGYNSEVRAAERASASKKILVECFDSGDATPFWSTWTTSVPPHLVASSRESKALKFLLSVHFSTFALKLRAVNDPVSPFPCSPDETEGLSALKQMLHDASEDEEIMSEATLFPFFTLGSITHPHQHTTFSSRDSAANIFETDAEGGFLKNTWTLNLREQLVSFCDNRLPLVTPPKLVTLFQAFHKWETSLQSHVLESVALSNDFHDVCLELLGQNVKLVTDMAAGKSPSPTYVQNMKRFIISKKHRLDRMKKNF